MNRLHPADWRTTLARTPGAALLVFTSQGCRTCARVKDLLHALQLPFSVTLHELDAEEAASAARALEVFHLPALFLFRDGAFHAPIHAEATPSALAAALVQAHGAAAQEEP